MSEAPTPFASHLWLETSDLDEVREQMSQVLRPHRLTVLRGGSQLRVVQSMAQLGGTTFLYVDHDADMQVSADDLGFVLVQIPLAGSAIVRAGIREVVATPEVAAVSAATDAPSFRYLAPNPRLMIRIDPQLLESRLALALGDRPRRPVRFDQAMDLTSPGGGSWRRLVDTIVADLDSGGPISRSPLAATSLERALVDGLLAVHAGSLSERIRAPGTPTRPRSLKKALSLLEDHCHEPLTTADVAEAVGVSVRSLQEAFRTHLDTTPMAHLRAVRMSRIHAELVAGGERTSVTDVALRWGVTHTGRFAQEYRRMYGQSPSQTLRQGH
ncbi:AraC family transcriptional regulator [Geodermatophilus sp. URMC 64]